MVKIAVAGNGDVKNVSDALIEFLKMSEKTVFSYGSTKYATFKQLANESADVFIAPVSFYLLEQAKESIDILVFSSVSNPDGGSLSLINENAFIIINSDDTALYSYLKGTAANLLTYGFNPKASVTASSIDEKMGKSFISLCIQRSFQALNGVTVEAQEIPVTLTGGESVEVLDEIAAITTAIALGINLGKLKITLAQ